MSDALTIVVVHVARQQGQSLLHVGQEFSLKAGPDFLQRRCLLRDQRQKRSRALGFLARRPSRWVILALVGQFLIFVKLVEHDICAPILGMSREVAIYRRIPVLVIGQIELCRKVGEDGMR